MKITIEEVRQVMIEVSDDEATQLQQVREAINKGLVAAYSQPAYYNYECMGEDWKEVWLAPTKTENISLKCISPDQRPVASVRVITHPEKEITTDLIKDIVSDIDTRMKATSSEQCSECGNYESMDYMFEVNALN